MSSSFNLVVLWVFPFHHHHYSMVIEYIIFAIELEYYNVVINRHPHTHTPLSFEIFFVFDCWKLMLMCYFLIVGFAVFLVHRHSCHVVFFILFCSFDSSLPGIHLFFLGIFIFTDDLGKSIVSDEWMLKKKCRKKKLKGGNGKKCNRCKALINYQQKKKRKKEKKGSILVFWSFFSSCSFCMFQCWLLLLLLFKKN